MKKEYKFVLIVELIERMEDYNGGKGEEQCFKLINQECINVYNRSL